MASSMTKAQALAQSLHWQQECVRLRERVASLERAAQARIDTSMLSERRALIKDYGQLIGAMADALRGLNATVGKEVM